LSKEDSTRDLAGLLGSLAGIAAGAGLVLDDYKDLGKDGSERDPPMPHHYMWGIIALLGGLAGTCLFGISLLKAVKFNQSKNKK